MADGRAGGPGVEDKFIDTDESGKRKVSSTPKLSLLSWQAIGGEKVFLGFAL